MSASSSVEDNHMFPGQFWDEDAQLAYNWNRWYSPDIGRYLQVDPKVSPLAGSIKAKTTSAVRLLSNC